MSIVRSVHSHRWSDAVGAFSIVWIVATSGGVFLNSKAVVNYGLIFNAILVVVQFACLQKKILRVQLRPLIYFFLLTACILLSLLANWDFASWLTYARLILATLIAMGAALLLDKERIIEVFVRTVFIIALCSVVFFYTGFVDTYANAFPTAEFNNNSYVNAFVYLHFESIERRNFGIYIEPGLFQVYLNIALYVLLYAGAQVKQRVWLISILLAAIYATKSTTGYILTAIILAGYAFVSMKGQYRRVLVPVRLGAILLAVGLLVTSDFFSANLEDKFLADSQLSFITRKNSTLIDLDIIYRHPLVGVGFGNYKSQLEAYDAGGMVIDAATNTFSQIGALVGLPLLLLVVARAVMFIIRQRTGLPQKIVLVVVYVICFATEPLVLYPLFYLPAFMSFSRSRASQMSR